MLHRKIIKSLFLITFIFFSLTSTAKNYYLSSSSGNDNNSGTDPSSPWQSLDKLNSFYNFSPGDNIYFKRGDTFYGSINITKSGTSGSPITYSAYGSGQKPIITGFTWVADWNNIGGNIWESKNAVSSLPYTNLVAINNLNTPMGRYPNSGFFTVQSHYGNSSITSTSLAGSPDWTGAEIVNRKERWVFEKGTITWQSGNTLSYSDGANYTPTDGFGFFIQNDSRTLDVQNEWYYNSATKKIQVYSTSTPYVQVPSIENLVSFGYGINYITIDNISFTGANSSALKLSNINNITIQNCSISFAGIDAITAANSPYVTINNNDINQTNDNGIRIGGDCPFVTVTHNTVKNVGLIAGLSQTHSLGSISCRANNSIVEYNIIENSGYNGMDIQGNNISIKNNYVNNSCLTKDDGGGIYITKPGVNREISNNIVLNSIGTALGTNAPENTVLAHGIFLEYGTTSVTVSGNSVSGCSGSGIFLHNASDIIVKGNTSFNNGIKDNFVKGGLMIQYDASDPSRNIRLNDNIFVAKTNDQLAVFCYVPNAWDLTQFGTTDNNYFARPINDNNQILVQGDAITWPGNSYNISSWISYLGQDANSKGSPKTISTTDDLRFEYNASSSSKIVPLDATYIDVKGNSYNGTITLQPFTSAVLIKNGASTTQPVTADAGKDQTISLPTNSATLSGSGTGSITSYQWRQLSGPSSVMSTIDISSAIVNNLLQGVYQFELKVSGANDSRRDTVQVTVNNIQSVAAPSITANAGPDQTIILPKNSATLSGGGSGPIDSYQWRQLSGPSIVMYSVDNSSAQVSDLMLGSYEFELKVTNGSSSRRDTMRVNVNSMTVATPAAPITANAGDDQTIYLPTNVTTLSGSGTGPITAFQWRQLSGPSKVMYSVDNSYATVTDLVEGVYEFELKTLRADDVSKRDTMKVIVSSGQKNTTIDALTVDAGKDQNIVLPNNTVNLSGTGTGPITAFQWRQLSGPSIAMHSIDNAAATVSNLIEGVYKFELKVLTTNDISKRDTMEVTVMSPASVSPDLVVDAGPDQTITLPTNTATLSGAGRGANIAFQWRQLSGPSKVMYSVDNAWTQVTGLIQGNYQFELKVVNRNDISVRDTMQVTVNVSNTTFASKTSTTNTTSGITLGDKEAFESISAPPQKAVTPTGTNLKIFPNPVEDETTLQINIAEPNSNVVIQISDMKGALVYKKQLTAGVGLLTEQLNMSGYTDGTYSITVIVNSVEKQTIQAIKL